MRTIQQAIGKRVLLRRFLIAQHARQQTNHRIDQYQCRQLAASKIAHMVAVSCNTATFARDARILIDGGFKLDSVVPVDQFRHTPHVELVTRFRR